jgi:hypothetical protein
LLRRDWKRLQAGCQKIVDQRVADIAARPAADHVGDDRAGIVRLGDGGAMGVTHIGFLAKKKGGADLHGAGAEHERSGRDTAVRHPAGGDDRKLHRVDDLRQERQQSRLRADVDAGEGGAMAPGLRTLRDDRVDPRCSSSRAPATVVALDGMKIPADFRARTISGSGKPR